MPVLLSRAPHPWQAHNHPLKNIRHLADYFPNTPRYYRGIERENTATQTEDTMETTTTQTTTATAPKLSIRPYYKKDLLVEYNTGEQHFLLWGEYNLEVTYNADGYLADSPNWDTNDISTWRNYYTLTWNGGQSQLVSCDGQEWETLEDNEATGNEEAELATIEIL